MKRSPLVVLVVALMAAATFTVLPTQQPAAADSKSEEVLHETMETLGKNYRLVRRQMGKADMNADTADKLAEMIDAAHQAKTAIPDTATTGDLKTKYRVIMNKLIIILAQAENAALEGDQDKLREYVLDANNVKGEGHELFIADDE
ncbi:MAG: cytochrome b562 [Phycisphaeraceae bacterium]